MNNHSRGSALQRVRRLLRGLLALVLLAGCGSAEIPGIPGLTAQGTPTPHLTLVAIERMLTATASIPTPTHTPLPTNTPLPLPTGTATAELPVEGQVGQTLTAKNVGLTVLSNGFVNAMGDVSAAQGSTFLDLEVVIENLASQSEGTFPYTSVYFTLRDTAGAEFSAYSFPQDALNAGIPPRLLGGDLLPGEMVRGHVAFEVPIEPGMLTLHFNPPASAADLVPPMFVVSLSQAQGSIPNHPNGSIPATGPASSDAWLSDSLPGQDELVSGSGVSLKIEMVRAVPIFEGRRAATGSRYLILDTVIRNDTRPQVPYNPQYFKVKDARGYEYPPIVLPGDDLLQAGSLGEGQSVKGMVIFQIPADTERVGVIYKPQVLSEEWDAFRIAINMP